MRDNFGQTALHAAIRNLYIDDNAEVWGQPWSRDILEACDNDGQTVLHAAAVSIGYDHMRSMGALVHHDYAAQDNAGQTLLHFAVAGDLYKTDCFNELIAQSDVQHTANNGQTALHVLSARDSVDRHNEENISAVAAKLIQAGPRYCLVLCTCSLQCILHLSNHNTDVRIVMNILILTACTGKCWACHCQKHCFVRH